MQINVTSLQLDDGKMVAANKYGQSSEEQQELELTEDELKIKDNIKVRICSATKIVLKLRSNDHRGHPFSTYGTFSEKPT